MEQGLVAYLAQQLDAAEITVGEGDEAVSVLAAEIGGKTVAIHANIANDALVDELAWVIVGVPEASRVVGKLYTCSVAISVCTPARLPGFSESDHRVIIAAVRSCFPDMPSLYGARARATTPEDIASTQAALDAGILKLQACSAALAASASVAISSTSAWFVEAARDGVMKGRERWEAITPIKMSVKEM